MIPHMIAFSDRTNALFPNPSLRQTQGFWKRMSSAVPESYPSRELDIQVNKWTPNCVDIKSTEEFRAVLDQPVSFDGVIPTLRFPKGRNLPPLLTGLRNPQ